MKALHHRERALLTLPLHHDVHIARFQRLDRKQRRMPAAQDDGELRIPILDGLGCIHGVFDHGSGHHRDAKTQSVLDLIENALLVVGSNGGVNDANVESSIEQRRGNSQEPQWRRGFNARKRWNKENDLPGFLHANTPCGDESAANRMSMREAPPAIVKDMS